MKIKILSIKKRNWLARSLYVKHWTVAFEYDGKTYKDHFWAGVDNPDVRYLTNDIRGYIQRLSPNVKEADARMLDLTGKTLELS